MTFYSLSYMLSSPSSDIFYVSEAHCVGNIGSTSHPLQKGLKSERSIRGLGRKLANFCSLAAARHHVG